MWSALRAETTSPIYSDASNPRLVVSLLRAYHITPRPFASLRREAHSATLQHSNRFLPHSLPRLPQLALFACSHGNDLYVMVSMPRGYFLLHCSLYQYDVHSQHSRARLCGV